LFLAADEKSNQAMEYSKNVEERMIAFEMKYRFDRDMVKRIPVLEKRIEKLE